MDQIVPFEKVEVIPKLTEVYQVEDGTIFYFKRATQRLFVKFEGREIYARNIPISTVPTLAVFGNAVYFSNKRQIYKAVCQRSLDIAEFNVTLERELLEDVMLDGQGLCSMLLENDSKYVFRMCDDFTSDGIVINKIADVADSGYMQERIHKGKLYYVKNSYWGYVTLRLMGEKVIGVQLPMKHEGTWHSYVNDTSPYLYISHGHCLYTLNMETMKTLPVLDFGNVGCLRIVGVVFDKITATFYDGEETHLITAQIPEGFYDSKANCQTYNQYGSSLKNGDDYLHSSYPNAENVPDWMHSVKKGRNDEDMLDIKSGKDTVDNSANEKYLDQALQKFENDFQATDNESADDKKQREYEAEMSATINELIVKNIELTEQIEELKKTNQESENLALAGLCERNSELTNKHKKLETLNWELTNELGRTEDLNEELETANERLSKEKEDLIKENEKMEKEKSATIDELEEGIASIEEEIEEMESMGINENDSSTVDSDDIEELKRRIEMMSKILPETADSSSGDEYELIDDVLENAANNA